MTRLLRAEEVAELLQVPTSWVYRASRKGTLPTVRCGRYCRYDERDVTAWIEGQRNAGTSS